MKNVVVAISLFFLSHASLADETRVREIVVKMDCHLTEMGKGVSRLRELTNGIEADSNSLLEVANSGDSLAKGSNKARLAEIFERGSTRSPEFDSIKIDLARGLLVCGYNAPVQAELMRIMPVVAGQAELLEEIELFATANATATDIWDSEMDRFGRVAFVATERLRTITRMLKEETKRIRSRTKRY